MNDQDRIISEDNLQEDINISCKRLPRDREHPYYMTPRSFIDDFSITLELKGFLLYCFSKPDGWEYNIKHLASVHNMCYRKCLKLVNEGIQAGYVQRITLMDGNLICGYQYLFSEEKLDSKNVSDMHKTCIAKTILENKQTSEAKLDNSKNSSDVSRFRSSEKVNLVINKENIRINEEDEEERACARPSSSASPKKIFLNFEARKFEGIDSSTIKVWKELYHKINVLNELRQCLVKAMSLGKREDWTGFILNWLQNSQNSAKEPEKKQVTSGLVEEKLKEIVSKLDNKKFGFTFFNDRMEYFNRASNFTRVIFFDTVDFTGDLHQMRKNIGF